MTATLPIYPPGPTDWRRDLLAIQHNPVAYLQNLQRTYGNFVHYRHGPAHCYLVNDPDLIRMVLVDQTDKLARADVVGRSLGKFLGNGLLIASGEAHHAQRRTMQPMFTPSYIAGYAQIMGNCADELTAGWGNGESRDVAQEMADLSMNIIYQTLFGSQPGELHDSVRSGIGTLQAYSGEMLKRTPQISEAECQTAVEQLDGAVQTLIDQHRREQLPDDFLSRLMTAPTADGHPFSATQVRDEAVTLMVAGQETTAVALAWTLYLLALHPEIQERVRQEAQKSESLALSDYPLTENVLKESLRLYPPAWLIGRTPLAPFEINGYLIQPGDTIAVSPYVLHHSSEAFPEPERFWPERFDVEPPRYTYLPFGAGAYVCIGQPFAMQEMLIVIRSILRNWRVEWPETDPVELEPLVTLRPKNGIRLILHKVSA